MKASVIIPTYNRAGNLPVLLRSLEAQTCKDFEVLLVDDGSTDNTSEVLPALMIHSPLDLTTHRIPNTGRAGSRNYGARMAAGDILIFFDDDVRPNENAIARHIDFHRRMNAEGLCILGGPYVYDQRLIRSDFARYRAAMEANWYRRSGNYGPGESIRINGGNFSMFKSLFAQAGGFDERLRDKEDFKLAFDCVYNLGAKVYFDYETWVYHDDFKSLREYIRRGRESRLEEYKLAALDPRIAERFPARFANKPDAAWKVPVFGLFRSDRLVQWISESKIVRFLPSVLRYKLYAMAITSNISFLARP